MTFNPACYGRGHLAQCDNGGHCPSAHFVNGNNLELESGQLPQISPPPPHTHTHTPAWYCGRFGGEGVQGGEKLHLFEASFMLSTMKAVFVVVSSEFLYYIRRGSMYLRSLAFIPTHTEVDISVLTIAAAKNGATSRKG